MPDEDDLRGELAIRNLVARYCDAVARRDEKSWGDTWSEDGAWHVLGQTVQGRAAVVERWKQLMAGLPFIVQIPGAGLVRVDGSRGTGRWYINELGQTAAGAALMTMGVYHDEYACEAGRWLFRSRRFDIMYAGPPDLSAKALGYPADAPSSEL